MFINRGFAVSLFYFIMERRINRGNKYPNGSKCTTPLKLLEAKKQREQRRKEVESLGKL